MTSLRKFLNEIAINDGASFFALEQKVYRSDEQDDELKLWNITLNQYCALDLLRLCQKKQSQRGEVSAPWICMGYASNAATKQHR